MVKIEAWKPRTHYILKQREYKNVPFTYLFVTWVLLGLLACVKHVPVSDYNAKKERPVTLLRAPSLIGIGIEQKSTPSVN